MSETQAAEAVTNEGAPVHAGGENQPMSKEALLEAMNAAAQQADDGVPPGESEGDGAIDNGDDAEGGGVDAGAGEGRGAATGDEGADEGYDGWGADDGGEEGDGGGADDDAAGRLPRNFRGRWDHLDENERRVVALTTKHGLTLAEAHRAVYGVERAQAATAATEAAAQADPIAEIDAKLAEKQAAVTALEAKLDGGDDWNGEDAGAVRKQYREALAELSELKADRKIAEKEKALGEQQKQESERGKFEQSVEASLASAHESFPDAFTEGSELSDAVAVEFEFLQATESPMLRNPNYPKLVIQRVARQLGIRPAAVAGRDGGNGAVPAPAPVAAAPAGQGQGGANGGNAAKGGNSVNRGVRPVPAGGSPVAEVALTLEERMKSAKTPEEMLELLKEYGTPIV